ncbi:MAG: hypothetical protein HUU50_15815 [Candidatus Brocadiae bacterium]|nr:hypothetical protein [Candidatus Brocadiia bacterium]
MEEVICSAKKRGRDLTIDSLKVAGKEVVRDAIIIIPKDGKKKKDGLYQFSISYRLGNNGYLSCKDFENYAYFNDKIVSKQQGLSMGPNEFKVFTDKEVELDIKDGSFLVRVDALSKVMEDDETNNDISTKLFFRGFESGAANAPALHIEMLRIAGRTPVQGRVKLTKQDSVGQKEGRYAFPVEYVMRNFGVGDATEFDNLYFLDGKSFFRQPKLSLKGGDSQLVQLVAYLPPRSGKLTLKVDAGNKYSKSPQCKDTIELQLMLQGFSQVP